MRIKHLRIRNFTSLVNVELLDLPNLVVFIGKNSSGKSNVIDALALLLSEPPRKLGDIDDYHHLFPNHDTLVNLTPEISAILTLAPQEWEQILTIDPEVSTNLDHIEIRLSKRIVNIGGIAHWTTYTVKVGGEEYVANSTIADPIMVISGIKEEDGTPSPVAIETDEFLNGLDNVTRLGFHVIRTTENPRAWSDKFSERPPIIANEHTRALWEGSQSRGSRRRRWTKMAQEYARIAPNLQRPVGVASSIHLEEGPLSVPIGMTGEGSQAMLRLIDQLEAAPQIIAIDEPETHLHPGLIKQVGKLLEEKANFGNQFFVCTHSPFLIEQSSLKNFFVVRKENAGTEISPIGAVEGLRNTLLDIGMRPSDILFCDSILLVEGLSDEIVVNGVGNKIKKSLAERHIKIVRANGYPNGRRKIEFWAEVGRDAGLPLYLILDRNAQGEADIAINKNLIARDHCLILQKGNLEDCYPSDVLKKAASTIFNVEIEDSVPASNGIAELKKKLGRKAKGNEWKILLAEEVVRTITPEDIELEMRDIAEFILKVHREVDRT